MLQKQATRLLTVRRIMVIGGAAVSGALLSLGYYLFLRGSYEASAVLKHEMGMPEYRRLMNVAISEETFRTWAAQRHGLDAEVVASLSRTFGDAGRAQRNISPFFRVTKRDLRDVPPGKDEQMPLHLLGVHLEFVARAPERAVDLTKLAASYLRDAALWDAASEYVRRSQREYAVKVQRLEADLLRKSFEISQLNTKVDELRRLSARYPMSNRITERQLLSVNRESDRLFLPPLAQLVGTEAQLVDVRRSVDGLRRGLEQARVADAFFGRALELVGSLTSGANLLGQLEGLLAKVGRDFAVEQSDAVREILNEIGQTLTGFRITFVEQPPYLSADHVSVVQTVSPLEAASIGSVLGALIGALMLASPSLLAWLRHDASPARAAE